ncbi:MAG: twin-arginine translocation signal domain-containing protein, partial [Dongiaceae bacterium]
MSSERKCDDRLSRRSFMKASAAAGAATFLAGCATTQRRGGPILLSPERGERIRVGVIGCGGRGTGAAIDCVQSSP